VHWQVTRIITIMTVPNKSVSRADDNCVKFVVNRTTFVPSAPDRLQEKGAIVKDAARHASVAFRVPILIQCRPVAIQVSEAGRNASGGITLFGGPGVYRPFWKFCNRSPTHGLETKLSGSITRRPRRVPPADRPLGTPHLFSELRGRLIRKSSVPLAHSGRGRQCGRNHGGFDCRKGSFLKQALGCQRQTNG
jgi:hypothetical protein